jgi:hypothetical protein
LTIHAAQSVLRYLNRQRWVRRQGLLPYSVPTILILLDESRFLVHWLIDFSPGQNLV